MSDNCRCVLAWLGQWWRNGSRWIFVYSNGFQQELFCQLVPLVVGPVTRCLYIDLCCGIWPTIWYCTNYCYDDHHFVWMEAIWCLWMDMIWDHKYENCGILISFARICRDNSVDRICFMHVRLVPRRGGLGWIHFRITGKPFHRIFSFIASVPCFKAILVRRCTKAWRASRSWFT
jgi:hypothetical protein